MASRKFTAPNVAALSTLASIGNGKSLILEGYYSAGDGGGQTLVYRSTGRESITIDNGWYFAGSGAADYYEAVDKSVANVRRFGAKGDSLPDGSVGTDDTAAFNAARDAINRTVDSISTNNGLGGGTIYVPRGCYAVNFYLTKNSTARQANLVGEVGGAYLTSYTSGGWAVSVDNNIFNYNPFSYPTIENIGFVGRRSSVARISNGLCCGGRFLNLRNVVFADCLIGMVCTDSYYGAWRDLNFNECDVACLLGTFGTGTGVINDLVDGNSSTVTTTLPVTALNSSGHSGNKLIDHMRIKSCRFGLVLAGPSAYAPNLEVVKPTIESCAVGLWVRQGAVNLRSSWFESNGQAGSLVLDGMTCPGRAGIVCSAPSGLGIYDTIAGTVTADGGVIGSVYVGTLGKFVATNYANLVTVPTTESGASLLLDNVQGDQLAFPYLILRPAPLVGTGRAISCWVQPKTERLWNQQPPGGSVLISDDCTHTSLRSSRLSVSSGSLTYSVTGGVFSDLKCIQHAAVTSAGWNLDISGQIDTGKFYALVITVKTPEAATWGVVNLAGTWSGNTPTVPANVWTTVCMLSRFSASGGGADPRWRVTALTGTQNLLFSGIQVIEFAALSDAQQYCASPYFYMTEE